MDNLNTIQKAIREQTPLKCFYNGYERHICPHAVGYGKSNILMVLSYQYAGHTSSGGLPQWRCMELDKMSQVEVMDCVWRTDDSHSKPQTCIKRIITEIDH